MINRIRKPLIIFYKKFSRLYGKLKAEVLIKNKGYKLLNINFFKKDLYLNEIKYNLNNKKILKSRENFCPDFRELTFVLSNKYILKFLQREITKRKLFYRQFGIFSIFKDESEELSLKLKINLDFLLNFNKKKIIENFFPKEYPFTIISSDFSPIIGKTIWSKKNFPVHFLCCSKLSPNLSGFDRSLNIFKKIGVFNVKINNSTQIKWGYICGFIFRCSILYFLSQSDLCRESTLKRNLYLAIQFSYYHSLIIKFVTFPIFFFERCHFKNFKEKLSIYTTFRCFKENDPIQRLSFFKKIGAFFLDYLSSKTTELIFFCFWKCIKKNFQKGIVSQSNVVIIKFFSQFYSLKDEKILTKKPIFDVSPFLKKTGGLKCFRKMMKTSFSYYPTNSIFIVNPKLFLSNNIIVNFLKIKLLSRKVHENKKIKGIIKMEKKKSIFELAINSIESHIGLTFYLIIFSPNATKILFSFKIKSNWEFVRVVFSNKKSSSMDNNIISYALIHSQIKNFNLNVKSNYFQKQTIQYSNSKNKSIFFLDRKKISKRNNKKGFDQSNSLKIKLANCFFEIFCLDNVNQIGLKFFSISRKISKKNFSRSVKFIHSFLIGLFFWIKIQMIFKKLPKNLSSKLLNKNLKEKYRFLQKINFEFYSIIVFYQTMI